MLKLDKKKKRTLAYVGIIGGCAILAITFFTISQFLKAKYQASEMMYVSCKTSIVNLKAIDTSNFDEQTLEQHNELIHFWEVTRDSFLNITYQNAGGYKATAIPAYLFSMATLVAFGLVLKHADKVKEEEEKDV